MENMKANFENHSHGSMQSSQLRELFEDELKDIYWAEKALTKAIPRMVKNATSEELIEALTSHLGETEAHVTRIEKVWKIAKQVLCVMLVLFQQHKK